jgi:hypothetical protein
MYSQTAFVHAAAGLAAALASVFFQAKRGKKYF